MRGVTAEMMPLKTKDEEYWTQERATAELAKDTANTLDRYPYGAYHYAGRIPESRFGITHGTLVHLQASRRWRTDSFVTPKDLPAFHSLTPLLPG